MNRVYGLAKIIILSILFVFVASPVMAQSATAGNVSSTKVAACKLKEANVKTRMKQLTQFVNIVGATLDDIGNRVETYYSSTVLPTGKTVTNYDTLVTGITSQKNATKTRLGQTETDVDNFNCTGEDPKALMNQFKIDMQAETTDLKNYRSSIANLIVEIKIVSRTAEKTSDNTK